mmetsp:Transcript_939/g.2436  ORF Transcript_939/g.2436 Transcript_939/m.2436 type:complete len:201 (+) Transcript_939:580-1182(+)
MVRIARVLQRAVGLGRRHVAKLEPDRSHCVTPWASFVAAWVAAEVVPAEPRVRIFHMCLGVLVGRLARPHLTGVARLGDADRAAIVLPIRLRVAVVRTMVTIGPIPPAALGVTHFVTFGVVQERRQAAISATRVAFDAILLVPRARLIEAGLIAIPVVHPRCRTSGGAQVLDRVLARVAAIALIPHTFGGVASFVADLVA